MGKLNLVQNDVVACYVLFPVFLSFSLPGFPSSFLPFFWITKDTRCAVLLVSLEYGAHCIC